MPGEQVTHSTTKGDRLSFCNVQFFMFNNHSKEVSAYLKIHREVHDVTISGIHGEKQFLCIEETDDFYLTPG